MRTLADFSLRILVDSFINIERDEKLKMDPDAEMRNRRIL